MSLPAPTSLRGEIARSAAFRLTIRFAAVFVVCLLEFLLVRECATSTFLILTAITLLDLVCGFAISLRSATRDVNLAAM